MRGFLARAGHLLGRLATSLGQGRPEPASGGPDCLAETATPLATIEEGQPVNAFCLDAEDAPLAAVAVVVATIGDVVDAVAAVTPIDEDIIQLASVSETIEVCA